jgi:hypothetical protein
MPRGSSEVMVRIICELLCTAEGHDTLVSSATACQNRCRFDDRGRFPEGDARLKRPQARLTMAINFASKVSVLMHPTMFLNGCNAAATAAYRIAWGNDIVVDHCAMADSILCRTEGQRVVCSQQI